MANQPLEPADIVHLTRVIADGPTDDATEALQSLALLDLTEESWRSVESTTLTRFAQPAEPAIISAAATIPRSKLRGLAETLAGDQLDPRSDAALNGLIEVRSPGIVKHASRVVSLAGFRPLAELPYSLLTGIELPALATPEPDPAELVWQSIAAAKAGDDGPFQQLLDDILADQEPSLFWGDPEDIASELRTARPLPKSTIELLTTAHDSSAPQALSVLYAAFVEPDQDRIDVPDPSPNQVRGLDDILAVIRQVQDDSAGGVGAANELLLDLADDPPLEFEESRTVVEAWLDGVHVPDDQMAWIVSNSLTPKWPTLFMGPLRERPDALRCLHLASQWAQADPPLLGGTGGARRRSPSSVPVDPPRTEAPPLPASVAVPVAAESVGSEAPAPPKMAPPRSSSGRAIPPPPGGPGRRPPRRKGRRRRDREELQPAPPAPTSTRTFQASRKPEEPQVLQFEFSDRAPEMPVGLFGGSPALAADELTEPLLRTTWLLHSASQLGAADDYTTVTFDHEGWLAQFQLDIPKDGNSEIRYVELVDAPDEFSIDIRVVSEKTGDVIRTFTIDETDQADARWVAEEIVATSDAAVEPPFEWTTPPSTLVLSVVGNSVVFQPSDDLGQGGGSAPWPAANLVDDLISQVRAHASTFRATYTNQLNAIDPTELTERLSRDLSSTYLYDTQGWSPTMDPGLADATADQAWTDMAESNELRELAYRGSLLFDTFFPPGTPLRKIIDSMLSGSRINLHWPVTDSAPSIPWNLLYTEPFPPAGPVSAEAFFGLRFRLSWLKWTTADPTLNLGTSARVNRVHLLYAGTDSAGAAATSLRNIHDPIPGHRVLPSDPQVEGGAATAAAQLLGNAPPDLGVLHTFCHCSLTGVGNEPALVFGPATDDNNSLSGSRLGTGRFGGAPLVFINACDSARSDAYHVNQLEKLFFDRGCRAFLGTEIRVPIELAARYATIFFALFELEVDNRRVWAGEAAAQARRYLWLNYRNIGGLFYTYIHHYGLRLESQGADDG